MFAVHSVIANVFVRCKELHKKAMELHYVSDDFHDYSYLYGEELLTSEFISYISLFVSGHSRGPFTIHVQRVRTN